MRNFVFVMNFETIVLRFVMGCLAIWAPLLLVSYRLTYIPYFFMCLITIPIHKFKTLDRSHLPMLFLLFAFVAWCGGSVFWSLDRYFAMREFLKVGPVLLASVSLFCYFKTLSVQQVRSLIYAFLAGIFVTIYLMLLDHFSGFKLAHWKKWNPICMAKTYQFSVLILVLSLSLILSQLKMRSWLVLPCTFLAALLLYVFSGHYDYDAGPIALYLLGIGFVVAAILPRIFPVFIRYGIAVVLLTSPLLVHHFLTPPIWQFALEKKMNPSHLQRLELMEWGAKLIYEKPITGYGLGQSRTLSHFSRPRDYAHVWPQEIAPENDISRIINKQLEDQIDPITGKPPVCWASNAWHLHNGFMQVWVELGSVGLFLMVIFVFLGLKGMESFSVPRFQRAHFYGFLSAFLLIFSVSFGPWETWWLSTIIILFSLYYLNFRLHETRAYS